MSIPSRAARTAVAIVVMLAVAAPAAPVLAQKTSERVSLVAQTGPGGPPFIFRQIQNTGGNTGKDYRVPRRKALVITAITVSPLDPGNGSNQIVLRVRRKDGTRIFLYRLTTTNQSAETFHLGSGLVIDQQQSLDVENDKGSASIVDINVHGFIATRK